MVAKAALNNMNSIILIKFHKVDTNQRKFLILEIQKKNQDNW